MLDALHDGAHPAAHALPCGVVQIICVRNCVVYFGRNALASPSEPLCT